MKPSIALKSIFASIAYWLGVADWRRKRLGGEEFLILMYHRVIPKAKSAECVQPGMYVEPKTFCNQLRFLNSNFNIVALPELAERCTENRTNLSSKPFCALTFDDGWQDFYLHAFPILKANNVPSTVFLPTNYMGTDRWFLSDRLIYIVHRSENPEVFRKINGFLGDSAAIDYQNATTPLADQLESVIDALKGFDEKTVEGFISELSKEFGFDSKPPGPAFMTWDQVRELKNSGLILFGSHTANHRILTPLRDEEIRFELISSKQKLIEEHAADSAFIPFCYPNGNNNPITTDLVREAAYDLAVTTEKGWNRWSTNPFLLRRIAIHQDMTATNAMYACRITGLL